MAPRKAIAPTRKANKLEAAGVRGKAKASTRKTPAQQSKPATTKPTQGKAAPSIANEKALIDTNQHFNDSTNGKLSLLLKLDVSLGSPIVLATDR